MQKGEGEDNDNDKKTKRYALKKIIVQEEDQLRQAEKEIALMKQIPADDHICQILDSAVVPHPSRPDLQQVLILMELCERMPRSSFLLYLFLGLTRIICHNMYCYTFRHCTR